MSAIGNGLPPLPKPPSEPATKEITLTLPGDVLADLERAAKEQQMPLDIAVAMCVIKWRYPDPAPAAAVRARRGSRKT